MSDILATRARAVARRDPRAGLPKRADRRIAIESVYPELDGGRYPVKREVGDTFEVWADIVRDGHDLIAAAIKYRRTQDRAWREAPCGTSTTTAGPGRSRWTRTRGTSTRSRRGPTLSAPGARTWTSASAPARR